MTLRLARLAAVSALLVPVIAQADSRPTLLNDYAGPRTHSLEFELGWYTESEDSSTLHALATVFTARFSVADDMDVELDWPFGFASMSWDVDDGSSEFRSGNPFLAGYYVRRVQSGYLRVGFGVGAPLSYADDTSGLVALATPLVMRGMWDSWLYLPERLSFVIPFQIESHRGSLLVGADSAMALLIPTGDDGATDFAFQLAGLIGGRHKALSAGVRLQLVWMPTASGDNALVAVAPFIQGDFTGGFIYLRVLVNLDEPYGVFGDGADVWGLYVGGGGRF